MATEALQHLDQLRPQTQQLLRQTAVGLRRAQRARERLRAFDVDAAFGGADVLLLPGGLGEAPIPSTTGNPVLNRLASLLGSAGDHDPGRLGPDGLPLGLQLIARRQGDDLVLAPRGRSNALSVHRHAAERPDVIGGFRHAGIAVGDMEASLGFYRDVLGLRVVSDRVSARAGDAVGAPGCGARICVLAVPDSNVHVELLEYRGAGARPVTPRPIDPGAAHASFWVANIAALYERLQSARGTDALAPACPNIGTPEALRERSRWVLARAYRGPRVALSLDELGMTRRGVIAVLAHLLEPDLVDARILVLVLDLVAALFDAQRRACFLPPSPITDAARRDRETGSGSCRRSSRGSARARCW